MTTKILVVDDEHDLVRLVRYNLEREGFEVFCAYDGNSALDLAWESQPDLVILDLMLPDKSGFDVCREIKSGLFPDKRIPVIMLTARTTEQDRIKGFESGGDDYVTKPFSPRELVLRVQSMLGRPWFQAQALKEIEVGPVRVRLDEYKVFVEEEEIYLTKLEFRILRSLLRTPNVVKSREQLLSEVWEEGATEVLDRTVDAHVKRLRGKLGEAREYLETIRGVGYRFNA